MKFRTQADVLDRLEPETRRAMRVLEAGHLAVLNNLWGATVKNIEGVVMREFRQDFRNDKWDAVTAHQRGTLARIKNGAAQCLRTFSLNYKDQAKRALKSVYIAEAQRGQWMLDQTTPANITVKQAVPGIRRAAKKPSRRKREADSSADYVTTWQEALDAYMEAWADAFASQMRLTALHEGTITDAADAVDATRLGGASTSGKFGGLFINTALEAMQDARGDLAETNGDIVSEEIWQTLEDSRVCPICEEYDGVTLEEVGDEPPAHFWCRCFARIVPKAWAELLRSGDEDQKAAALAMDDRGLVPDAMAIRNANGELVNTFTVKFEQWLAKNPWFESQMSVWGTGPITAPGGSR